MLKRLAALLMTLLLLSPALAEEADGPRVPFEKTQKFYINFPTMDEWQGHFKKVQNWTIVTADNMEEHMQLLLQRGESEEAVRARFARETLLFEAYSSDLPADACFRAEMIESELTREVWHLRHLNSTELKELHDTIESGLLLPDRDVYNLSNKGGGEAACITGYFTNYPPERHESGKMMFRFRNGRLYVFSYCVSGRQAGASRWYSSAEETQADMTPLALSSKSAFKNKMLPRMPDFTLDQPIPAQAGLEDLVITGTIEKGSSLHVAHNSRDLEASVDKSGRFSVTVPLRYEGDHQVTFTVTNKKYTDRVETRVINASDDRTPLTLLEQPDVQVVMGEQTISGVTAPGAQVVIQLDEGDNTVLTAGADGAFTHVFTVEDNAMHVLRLAAAAPDKAPMTAQIIFYSTYKSVEEGLKDYAGEVVSVSLDKLVRDPGAYQGSRVKASVIVKDVAFTQDGLSVVCVKTKSRYSDEEDVYVHLSISGYAQCKIYDGKMLTVYGVVDGETTLPSRDGEGETTYVNLDVDYITYSSY